MVFHHYCALSFPAFSESGKLKWFESNLGWWLGEWLHACPSPTRDKLNSNSLQVQRNMGTQGQWFYHENRKQACEGSYSFDEERKSWDASKVLSS